MGSNPAEGSDSFKPVLGELSCRKSHCDLTFNRNDLGAAQEMHGHYQILNSHNTMQAYMYIYTVEPFCKYTLE